MPSVDSFTCDFSTPASGRKKSRPSTPLEAGGWKQSKLVVQHEACHWSLLARDVKGARQKEQVAAVAQTLEQGDAAASSTLLGC